MDVLWYRRDLLNPARGFSVAWVLFSHKVCRWLVPPALIVLYGASAVLADGAFYFALLLAQSILYLLPFLSKRSQLFRDSILVKGIRFFLVTNAAVLVAWIRFLRGERAIVWEPTKR